MTSLVYNIKARLVNYILDYNMVRLMHVFWSYIACKTLWNWYLR